MSRRKKREKEWDDAIEEALDEGRVGAAIMYKYAKKRDTSR